MRNIISGLLCVAFTAVTASGAVIRVPQDQPTIAQAEAAAANGDTIWIDRGRWQEVVTTSRTLTFKGTQGTIWDGYFSGSNAHHQLVATADNVKVLGIEFQNGDLPVSITGDHAQVAGCKFRGTERGVFVDGRKAKVTENLFSGMQAWSGFAVDIDGPDAVVGKNTVRNSYGFGIEVDAESNGSATVTDNLLENNQYYGQIAVSNASAPKVLKNVLSNCYIDGACIDVDSCDDAKVVGNQILNTNYDTTHGIYVDGDRALVSRNLLDNLNGYSNDCYGVYVSGVDASVLKNRIFAVGAGNDYDTWGVYVSGDRASVQKNVISDFGGGGDETYGIQVDSDDATVAKNKVMRLNDEYTYGLYLRGDRMQVARNSIAYVMDGNALYVGGDDFKISRNTCRNMNYGCYGIETSGSATTPGAAAIEHNAVVNSVYVAFYHDGSGVILRDNSAKNVAEVGFEVSGSNNILERCSTRDTFDDGFYVSGSRNSLLRCVARDSDRDGFDITSGPDHSLEGCKALNCVGEGLDNGGTATVATHCVLRGSRIDYAGSNNMADDAGTVFSTGGSGQSGQVD